MLGRDAMLAIVQDQHYFMPEHPSATFVANVSIGKKVPIRSENVYHM